MYKEVEQHVSTQVLPIESKNDIMFGYKELHKQRRNQIESGIHRFRNSLPGKGTGVPTLSTRSSAANVIHHYSHFSNSPPLDDQSSRARLQKSGEFIAYITERDGLGYLKDTQDSTLQQLVILFLTPLKIYQVREKNLKLNNQLRWSTEKNLNLVRRNQKYRVQA